MWSEPPAAGHNGYRDGREAGRLRLTPPDEQKIGSTKSELHDN